MNRLLCFITTACIAAVIILAGNSTVGASDTQALDPAKSTSEKGPDIPTQDDSQNAAKSGSTAKINVDSQGGYSEGVRRGRLLQTRKTGQRESRIREHVSRCNILICLVSGQNRF